MSTKKNSTVKMFRISNKVSIPISQETILDTNFIPKDINFEDTKHAMEQVGIAMNNNIPVLLVGETGTGKTSLVRHLACKTNNAFVRVNHNGGTSIEDIVGRYLIDDKGTRWNDGILIEAMKKGYWFLADEINAASPEINFVYHSLLDDDSRVILVEKGHEVVIPHPNFRFFAAMNPSSDYAGTKELNKALLSRHAVINIDFAPPNVEAEIIAKRTGVNVEIAKKMVKFAVEIRANHAKQTMNFVVSTRDLIMWANMYKVYEKFMISAETTILNKAPSDSINPVKDIMGLHFKALDAATKITMDDLNKEPEAVKKFEVGARVKVTGKWSNILASFSMEAVGLEGIIISDETSRGGFPRNVWNIDFGKNTPKGKGFHNLKGDISTDTGLYIPESELTLI